MSGDARISTGLPGHPKTKKLIRRLGTGAAWNLVCLFLWAASNRSDGDFTGMSDEDLELAAQWSGDEGMFVAVLVDIRFLDGEEGAYCVHDWAEHNPWAAGAISRSYKARWNAAKRHHGDAEADRLVPQYAAIRNATSIAASTQVAMLQQESSNAPSPSPSPSEEQEAKASLSAEADPAPKRKAIPPCPHTEIVSLYHELLPANPGIKVWDGAREDALRTRWKEDEKRQNLDYWRRYLTYVSKSPFLTGREHAPNERPFLPGLDWLVKAANFAKVIEGRYHKGQQS